MTNQKTNILANEGYGILSTSYAVKDATRMLSDAWPCFYRGGPLEHKKEFLFGATGGYEFKDETYPDHKENFHFSLGFQHSVEKLTEADRFFLKAAENMIRVVKPFVLEIIKKLSDETGADFFTLLENIENWQLRCLHYFPTDREFLAIAHPDKGPLTIHLEETCPGLEIFWNGQWHAIEPPKEYPSVLYYPGLRGQLHSKSIIKGLTHRVVSTPESRKYGRSSIVLFCDPSDKLRYNKSQFHSTPESFSPGANYTMLHAKLNEYFIETADATVGL